MSRWRSGFARLPRRLRRRAAPGFGEVLEEALDAPGRLSLRVASFERALELPALARSRNPLFRTLSARLRRWLPVSQEDRSHGSR